MKLQVETMTDKGYYTRRPGGKERVHEVLLSMLRNKANESDLELLPESITFSHKTVKAKYCVSQLLVTCEADFISKRTTDYGKD